MTQNEERSLLDPSSMGERVNIDAGPAAQVHTLPSAAVWIVGASGRAAAESAVRAGFTVCVFDAFADSDTANLCPVIRLKPYPDAIRKWVGRAVASGQRPIVVWVGGMENHRRLLQFLADHLPVAGSPVAAVAAVRNPWLLAEVVQQSGAQPLRIVPDGQPPSSGTYVWKPFRSAGGHGIQLHAPDRGRPAIGHQPGTGYYQQFALGLPYGAVFVAAGGRAVLVGVTRQWCGVRAWGARSFQYCGSATVQRPPCNMEWLRRLGNLLAERFGLVGLFGVDLMCRRGEAYVLEVNPRYTASCEVLERAWDVAMVQWHLNASLHGELPAEPVLPKCGGYYGKAILYAQSKVFIAPEIHRLLGHVDLRNGERMADIPRAGTTIPRHSPVMTFLCQGESLYQLRSRLTRLAKRVQALLSGDTHQADAQL